MATESSALEQTRATILGRVEAGITEGPFSADWDSITSDYQVPDWYVDGKFRIFVHWGPYRVPAYSSEWYPREMYRQGTARSEPVTQTYPPPRAAVASGVGAEPLPPSGSPVRGSSSRAPRRIRHVRDGSEPMERGTDGAGPGRGQGAVRCRPRPSDGARRI